MDEGLAVFLSGLMTLVGALLVTFIGPIVLQKSVKGLEAAAQAADQLHSKITENFSSINEQLSALERASATVQNLQIENNENTLEAPNDAENAPDDRFPPEPGQLPGVDAREILVSSWRKAQSFIEDTASSSKIDGRTRAKYSRIDRRSYIDLIYSIHHDGNIVGAIEEWEALHQDFRRYRNPRVAAPTVEEAQEYQGRIERLLSLQGNQSIKSNLSS